MRELQICHWPYLAADVVPAISTNLMKIRHRIEKADMKRNRFSKEWIIGILKEQEACAAAISICPSRISLFILKAKFGRSNLPVRPAQADGADEQAYALLLYGEHMLNIGVRIDR